MDPCPFVRLTVGNLALKLPLPTKPARNVIHPTSSPCFCKIKLKGFHHQTAVIPYITPSDTGVISDNIVNVAAVFHLSKDDITKLTRRRRSSIFYSGKLCLKIYIFTGRMGATCGMNSGRMLGKVYVPLDDFKGVESRAVIFHNGWTFVGKDGVGVGVGSSASQFHVSVRADPDPRFVFQFDGEPECSPQVFQIQGNLRQPVFTCNFSFRNTGIGNSHQRNRSLQSEQGSGRGWLTSFGSERERPGKERKGWSVTVHDLSGSPVAIASMVTPFVASPGSDRVSRSNPGSWLILRPVERAWKPWGRLEAWRERGTADGVGYKFELIPEMSASAGVVLAECTLSTAKGGKFVIDLASASASSSGNFNGNGSGCNSSCGGSSKSGQRSSSSPGCSPRGGGSGDFGFGLWPYSAYRGFVMSANVEGEGKCSKPSVQVSVQHVSCTEDAAAFVALAAAIDLSIDACRLFSQKLRKELCPSDDMGC